MADSNEKPSPQSLSDALNSLQFGPAWAKESGSKRTPASWNQDNDRSSERHGPRRPQGRQDRSERRDFPRRDDNRRDQREQRPSVQIPAGIKITLQARPEALEAIHQQVAKTHHTFPLYTLAKFVVGERNRHFIVFQSNDNGPELIHGKRTHSLSLSQAEAVATLWANNEFLSHFYDTKEVEAEAPTGQFNSVARCGFSGTLLGPPNHHSYNQAVADLHRERFGNMSLERYKAKIESITDPEVIEAWRESMKVRRIWSPKDAPDTTLDSRSAVERHFLDAHYKNEFESGKQFHVPGNIDAKLLSPGLLEVIKSQAAEIRRKPAGLIPALCSALTHHRLAVFKWDGKLFCGPCRPHALPLDATIADSPSKILDHILHHDGIKVADLLQVLTQDLPDPEEARRRCFIDLTWLLTQGYALLLEGGELHVPKRPIKDRPQAEQEATLKSIAVQAEKEAEKSKAQEAQATEETPSTAADSEISEESAPDAE